MPRIFIDGRAYTPEQLEQLKPGCPDPSHGKVKTYRRRWWAPWRKVTYLRCWSCSLRVRA